MKKPHVWIIEYKRGGKWVRSSHAFGTLKEANAAIVGWKVLEQDEDARIGSYMRDTWVRPAGSRRRDERRTEEGMVLGEVVES